MNVWLLLTLAILAEVIGTTALKLSDGFTKLGPSLVVLIGYGLAFYLLSLTLKQIPVGVAYAIWAGVGIVLITLIGWLAFKQTLDWAAVLGIALIITGVVVLQAFSKVTGN
ncbi:DMT family transporter [Thiomicrospira microaerophila]|jgi:small multidrug resistance pump|uniref:DMT family transporter n=1 Tax=Thiomicrospira microaerophila TaxID=406020 RepID=UPI0005CA7BC8|nr:multidrug efflux SMR transporter [Thiomicrospira microaerophila]